MIKVIQYFFVPLSPWAYLGHQRLLTLARQHGALIEPKPFDLGKVFAATGGVALPKRAPQRQAYRLQELQRWSEFLGVPLNLEPKFFPPATPVPAAQLLIATRNVA